MNTPELNTEVSYSIGVSPLLAGVPEDKALMMGAFWQPTVGRWMVHFGREHVFRLITPANLKAVIRESLRKGLLVVSFRAGELPKLVGEVC